MRKLITSLFVFVLLFFAFSISQVSARVLSSEKGNVTVAKGEVINDDLFVGAQGATIDGIVNGDVFVGAQTVRISGTINGNLHVGGQSVTLTGSVKGNTYIGGQDIVITGANIGGSLLVGAQSVNIDKTSIIGGSLMTGAASLDIDSQIKRNVYAGAGMLTIGADAKIGKNLYYAAGQNQQTSIDKNAKIGGQIFKSETKTPPPNVKAAEKNAPKILGAAFIATNILSFIGALFVGLLYMNIFGRNFKETTNIVSRFFWKSFGLGFLIIIAFIPGLIVLLITVIGIPIAGLAVLWIIFYSYLAKIIVGAALGVWISEKTHIKMPEFLAFALGLVIIYLLKTVPIIGFLSGVTVLWVGLGALTLQLFSKPE